MQHQELTNIQLPKQQSDFDALGIVANGPTLDGPSSVHRLYDALDYLALLPDPAMVVKWVGKHQADRMENVSRAVAWLSALDEARKKHGLENGRGGRGEHQAASA